MYDDSDSPDFSRKLPACMMHEIPPKLKAVIIKKSFAEGGSAVW
jgi:hypothetical protein